MSEQRETLGPIDVSHARIELKVVQAALARLHAQRDSGMLMDRRIVDNRAFAFLRSIRDRMAGMGARHAADLAARFNRDPGEVAALLEHKLAALAARLAEAASSDPLFLRALRPDPVLSVSEWADRHRILSTRSAAEPGPYRTSRTPYLKAIMDDLSVTETGVRVVIFKKCAQIGATEGANC